MPHPNITPWSLTLKLAPYKARLVTNGRSQQQGIDYDETFTPVVKPTIICNVLSLAVSRAWPIHQLDVKNAFLYGHLSETVYMHQPPGFVDPAHPDYVCLLKKSLYGLKQAPRAWFQRFSSYAIRVGFIHSKTDSSLFVYQQGTETAYLLLYVDDIILTASSTRLLQQIISSLHTLKRILRYVRGTLDHGFQLCASTTSQLTAYSDADWAGCPSTRRSTSGYCVFLGDNLITWSSKRQHVISRSSAEAEYPGVANAIAETAWVCNLLRDLLVPL
ncbi:ribonuclease H-like domain-containing protein [Tanacetum coccineum]